MNNEITRIANDLEEKLRKTTAERNVFKAKYRSLITLMERMRSELRQITDHIEDEGDRVYFGSTNHADTLKHLANYAEMWVFDYELPPGDINKMEKDPYAEIRLLREENEALAAHQCLFLDGSGLTGDEGGTPICRKAEQLVEAKLLIRELNNHEGAEGWSAYLDERLEKFEEECKK